ncbi:hypothetical protein [Vreelandella profundi]|uniref:hypothetical protein n=1 Tax=Vreelandella profundi TaxID=2852117 RepID=UPI001EF08EAF|nr:hypothetical protein [Halomonas profundi]
MDKSTDIGTLSERLGEDFEYQQFTSDVAYSHDQQRWKLLDGIAKQAPGTTQKIVERSRPIAIPPIYVQEREQPPVQQAVLSRLEDKSPTPRVDISRQHPIEKPSKQRSFGHLFQSYTDNNDDAQSNHQQGTSLKALLRQINT